MPDLVTAARYHARDGTEHQALVERRPEGRWRVLDAVDRAMVVDTLTCHDDRLDQAAALTRDDAGEPQAIHDGERLERALPKPQSAGEESAWAA
jgi:hypothetical protein